MSLPPASSPSPSKSESPSLVRGLSLLDSVLLLCGGIIGSSIFLTAKDIAGPLPHPVLFLLVWVLGAGISLLGCNAFAELGSMFPDSGGQYVYLREAYGDLPAFLYGWMLFSVANGGTIAALSVASAAYLGGIVPAISQDHVIFAAAGIVLTRAHIVALIAIFLVTWINVVGLRWGTVLQNLGQVRCHGRFRNSGICHRQRRLASLLSGAGTKPHSGIERRAIDLSVRCSVDRGLLGLRRLGVHHMGFG